MAAGERTNLVENPVETRTNSRGSTRALPAERTVGIKAERVVTNEH